jgi:hypothetical protein
MPELDMVVVFTGGSYWESARLSPYEIMEVSVLPSVV